MDTVEWIKPTKSELARVKSVEEMVPKPAKNQLSSSNPTIWEEQYSIIEECLRMDGTIEEACILAWISVASYYHHRKINEDFARRMDIAKKFPKIIARAAVQKRIRQWDSRTALRFLELRDKRYKAEPTLEETENNAPVVQFISVASNEWAEKDWQTSTEQKSAYEWFASSWERVEEVEKKTPWENEDQALRNLDSLNFNVG